METCFKCEYTKKKTHGIKFHFFSFEVEMRFKFIQRKLPSMRITEKMNESLKRDQRPTYQWQSMCLGLSQ